MTKFVFDLQRFGGKGGTTVTQMYEPTDAEKKMQELEYNFAASCLVPNAVQLNDRAMGHLDNSGANIPVHYDDLFTDADKKILDGMLGLRNSLSDLEANAPPTTTSVAEAIGVANQQYLSSIAVWDAYYLDGLREWIDNVPIECYQSLSSIGKQFSGDVGSAVTDYGNRLTTLENNLNGIPNQLSKASNDNANTLTTYIDGISNVVKRLP